MGDGQRPRPPSNFSRAIALSLAAGAIGGFAGFGTFIVIHPLGIVPIWLISPMGVLIAAGGGMAVGWAWHVQEHHRSRDEEGKRANGRPFWPVGAMIYAALAGVLGAIAGGLLTHTWPMDLGTVLHVISVITGAIGIAMVFVPALALRPFGIRPDPTGALGARLFGAANIGLATALFDGVGWDPAGVQGLGNAVFYYCLVQGAVIVWAVIRNVANRWALGFVVLDAAFIAAIRWQGWPG